MLSVASLTVRTIQKKKPDIQAAGSIAYLMFVARLLHPIFTTSTCLYYTVQAIRVVAHTSWNRKPHCLQRLLLRCAQDRSQHGAKGQMLPQISVLPLPQMGSAPIMVVAWQWGNCLYRLVRLIYHSHYADQLVCTVVGLFCQASMNPYIRTVYRNRFIIL